MLVTRPQPGADETAGRIAALGFQPVALPLTRIVPLEPVLLPTPDAFDAVVVTSVNALRHAPPGLLAIASARPAFAVGDATAQAAREAGFRDVRSASGTAIDLAGLIGTGLPRGARLLHLAGRVRTAGFDSQVEADGFAIATVEVYDTEKVSYTTDFLSEVLGDQPLWGALVLSMLAGELTADLARQGLAAKLFERTRFFCISEKAARPIRALGAGTVHVSDEPTEAGVLALLAG